MPKARGASPGPRSRNGKAAAGNGVSNRAAATNGDDDIDQAAPFGNGLPKGQKAPKIAKGFEPDMDKPLVLQVRHMERDDYVKWVHTPHVYPKGVVARFFEWDFFEFFSRTPWYVVPLVWFPISCYLVWSTYAGAPPAKVAANYLMGVLVWTVIEYVLHRWLFHVDELLPQNGWLLTAHFLLHGVHHRIPMDRHRLVMPPALLTPLVLLVHSIWGGLLMRNAPDDQYYTMFAGAMFGYIWYDCFHYFSHHGWTLKPGSYLFQMRSYHMKHHFQCAPKPDGYKAGFGITSTLWDHVFGSVLKTE